MTSSRTHSIQSFINWFQGIAGLPSNHHSISISDECYACGKPARNSVQMQGYTTTFRQFLNEYTETITKDAQRRALEDMLDEVKSYGILDGHALKLKKWVKSKLDESKT